MNKIVISYQPSDFSEVHWLKRLLPEFTLDLVEDPRQTKVIPNSIVICKRLRGLQTELLSNIAKTPGVVLFHISDEWYSDSLSAYESFVHVLRNYYHPALRVGGVTQIPLGPTRFSDGKLVIKPISQRQYQWCFAGNLASTRRSMVKHLAGIKPHYLHITGTRQQSDRWLGPDEYVALLNNCRFVPCPMGNVNLESFRLYEALDCGAIPIVERRPWLDYFTQLFGPHPLPSVNHWAEASGLIQAYNSDATRLEDKQNEIRDWWRRTESGFSAQITEVLRSTSDCQKRLSFGAGVPSRWSGARQMIKHHNGPALSARVGLTLKRLRHLKGFIPEHMAD